MKRWFKGASLAALAFLTFGVGARADVTIGAPNNNSEIFYFGETNTAYYAQSFIAPGGLAKDMTFYMHPYGVGDSKFRVLLTEVGTNLGGLHPTTVLFESPTITVTPSATLQSVSVSLGFTPLTTGQTYAWVLDAFVAFDGNDDIAGLGGSTVVETGNVGHFFFYNAFGGDRSTHFADNWTNSWYIPSMAFEMNFVDAVGVPEPSSLAVSGTIALLGLALGRRKLIGR